MFSEIPPDPPDCCFTSAGQQAAEFQPDALLGIGGGSALDVAKLAAVLTRHTCALATLYGIGQVPGRGIPTVLVPTTAGTGSEVTPIAVVSDKSQTLKLGVVSDHIVADHAVVDPELCLSLPRAPTAYTGMDALTHAIEAYTNRHAVALIDGYALQAIALIAEHLPRAVRDGSNRDARYAMSLGSMLGGMCLGPVNTAAVHALAYPLGGRFDVPHGVANSLLLPHVMRFNAAAVGDRYDRIAAMMKSTNAIAAVEQLSHAVGTDQCMRHFGVKETDLPEMAAAAVQVTRLMNNNPREVSAADALDIYRAAW
jgi:alcohol dehydrogenase class IV